MFDVFIYGAERQAAVSAALSRPDLKFSFIPTSDHIVDGDELENVVFQKDRRNANPGAVNIVLDPDAADLSADYQRLPLDDVMAAAENIGIPTAECYGAPQSKGEWIVKGKMSHLPDLQFITDYESRKPQDRTNILYQEKMAVECTSLVVGRKTSNLTKLASVELIKELTGWEDIILACRTTSNTEIEERTKQLINVLKYREFFTATWVKTIENVWTLTSLRPYPRAVFQLLAIAGLDLLSDEAPAKSPIRVGLESVVTLHYSRYQKLI